MRDAGCNVAFTLDGRIRKFSSASVPAVVRTPRDLDRIHGEDADVKIVKEIKCCREKQGDFAGCAWPPKENSRSIILSELGAMLGNRWAHEFGHRMGLEHRGSNRVQSCPHDRSRSDGGSSADQQDRMRLLPECGILHAAAAGPSRPGR
jgi:hypothetical protein